MDIKKRINEALNKIENNRTINRLAALGKSITVGACLTLSPGTLQAQDNFQNEDSGIKKEITVTQNEAKHYHRIVNVNSLDEIRYGNRSAAEYNQYIDAFIYTQYRMNDANKSERGQIEKINADNYSVNSEKHEGLHRLFSAISQKTYDGTCILKVSDRIRTKIIEEICCLKAEKGLPSIMDAIQKFKELKRDEYYSCHYAETEGQRSGSILTAMIAEDKVPEKIKLGFERSNRYKPIKIGEQEYLANLYVSLDKKYQTWLLHDTEDKAVRSAEIAAQSPLAIGVMTTLVGKEVKMPDGKTVQTQYFGEATNAHGGWDGYSYFSVDNFDQRQEGFDFSRAEKNFDGICLEYAQAAGLNEQEARELQKYVSAMSHLNSYDLQDREIREIRNSYKNTPIIELIRKQKENYETTIALAREKFNKNERPYLVEVQAPSRLTSQNGAKSINTTAFYPSTKEKGGR